MARPLKENLDYFPFEVGLFDDEKILQLSNKYGPLGEAIYLRILCLIYRNGYYYKFKNQKTLSAMIIKSIGNGWISDNEIIEEIVTFLGEIDLLSEELLEQNILSSVGIQTRFFDISGKLRRQVLVSEFSLIDDKKVKQDNATETNINVAETKVNVTETNVNVAETEVNATFSATKKTKTKGKTKSKIKEKQTKEKIDDIKDFFSQINISPSANVLSCLSLWLEEFDVDDVKKAVIIAIDNKRLTAPYLNGIFKNWKNEKKTKKPTNRTANSLEQRGYDAAYIDSLAEKL